MENLPLDLLREKLHDKCQEIILKRKNGILDAFALVKEGLGQETKSSMG